MLYQSYSNYNIPTYKQCSHQQPHRNSNWETLIYLTWGFILWKCMKVKLLCSISGSSVPTSVLVCSSLHPPQLSSLLVLLYCSLQLSVVGWIEECHYDWCVIDRLSILEEYVVSTNAGDQNPILFDCVILRKRGSCSHFTWVAELLALLSENPLNCKLSKKATRAGLPNKLTTAVYQLQSFHPISGPTYTHLLKH